MAALSLRTGTLEQAVRYLAVTGRGAIEFQASFVNLGMKIVGHFRMSAHFLSTVADE
jgi:hypothetical protein